MPPAACPASAQLQGEGEAGARSGGAVDLEVAPHGAGEAAGDVEAEAGAPRLRRLQPLELVEDARLVLGRDALALIADDERAEILLAVGADPHLSAFGRMADG